jgi:hypothetical protein
MRDWAWLQQLDADKGVGAADEEMRVCPDDVVILCGGFDCHKVQRCRY